MRVEATRPSLIVTCEHGGNVVPMAYRALFKKARWVLGTHRGLDRGAARLARAVARRFEAPIREGRITRLVVDLNRSLGHPSLLSPYMNGLTAGSRGEVLERYYHPYRDGVEGAIRAMLSRGRTVTHLSVHSFTPVLRGSVRRADIGLLYDPGREQEKDLCRRWQGIIQDIEPRLRVRRNYPYRGTADGFIPHLRRILPRRYVGLELEVNQKWISHGGPRSARVRRVIIRSLQHLLEG